MSLARLGLLLAAAPVLPSLAPAQAPAAPVAAIRAGRLVDVERGEVRRDQLIVIRGDRIAAVEPGSTRPPAGARLIDLSRYSVLPGLIDCHAHLVGDISDADALLPETALA